MGMKKKMMLEITECLIGKMKELVVEAIIRQEMTIMKREATWLWRKRMKTMMRTMLD